MTVNSNFPVTITNNSGKNVNFHIFNPHSHNGFFHFDYEGVGYGHLTLMIEPGNSVNGNLHLFVTRGLSFFADVATPGNMDIAPDLNPGGTISL